MQLTVEMDVLIARILMPRSASARNICPAMPGRSRKSGPKMAMEATTSKSVAPPFKRWVKVRPQRFDRVQTRGQVAAVHAQHHLVMIFVVDHLHYELGVQTALAQRIQHGRGDAGPILHRQHAHTGQLVILNNAADLDLFRHGKFSDE